MSFLRLLSGAEQVAAHIRNELLRGRWKGTVPGIHQLADELGVNHKTVKNALALLENENLVMSQGPGRRRRVNLSQGANTAHPLRIAILTGDAANKRDDYMLRLLHELVEAGNNAFFAPGSLVEFGMDLRKVILLVKKTEADAWLVTGGSREVLEWFASQQIPAFALFGRRRGLPIASIGPDKPTAMAEVTRRLIELGHGRIVLLCRDVRRLPEPGATERAFSRELENHGITPGTYHLPDWDETPNGLHECLESLFRFTPPTALIFDEPPFLIGALQFLGHRKIRVPEDVSLIATDPDPAFFWCQPSIAHMCWDSRPWIRRVLHWAGNVSRGKDDRRQTLTKAGFVEGGTMGPANPGSMDRHGR